MVRVLFAAAIACFVISLAVLLPPALREPWQESIPDLAPVFSFPSILVVIAVVYKSARRPRTTRRGLWALGIIGLIGATPLIAIDVLARKTDVQSVTSIAGLLLVGVLSIVAARSMALAPSDGREAGARSLPQGGKA
jgi:peptidoglycan/LPS O-acetylase OafA/YrhL